jgi:hypothetical protein
MAVSSLPPGWPTRPVGDPEVFLPLVDLIVSTRDRRSGALHVLLCGAGGRLAQPCIVEDLPPAPVIDKPAAFTPFAMALAATTPGGSMAVVIARPGPTRTTDEDREWHEAAATVCRAHGLRLSAAAVATPESTWRLPEPPSSGSRRCA